MNKRYLIINADDYGLSCSTNKAIEHLFAQKAITSASLLVPAPAAQTALQQGKKCGFSMGVHWTLCSEWEEELFPSQAQATKEHSFCCDGKLPVRFNDVARRAKSSEVTAEIEAQVVAMQGAGLCPDHADCHGDSLYGLNGRLFFLNAFRLCKKYSLPFRFPKSAAYIARQMRAPVPKPLLAAHAAVKTLAACMGVALPDDMVSNPDSVPAIGSYKALCQYYLQQLALAGEGITEFFFHPAQRDPLLEKRTPEWQKRVWEYEFLQSGQLQHLATKEGFTMVSWGTAPF